MLNPDWAEACEVVCAPIRGRERRPFDDIHAVARRIATKHDITLDQLKGHSRRRHLIAARHEAFLICYRDLGRSLPQIARYFNNRDHTTVLHAIKKLEGGQL